MGDLCFPCFVLVKEYKKSPQEIAEELKRKLFEMLQKRKRIYKI
jgi:arginyl-tRNA synthetase